ncbi:MAG TPA: type II CAAX endopeptidase family protein [Verrucomicrobiae bacterium]|nr:type II CAAX endopeptidase family protein [Verrucomicrobiae bacterium]
MSNEQIASAQAPKPIVPKASTKLVAGKVPWSPWLGVGYAAFIFLAAQVLASNLIGIYPRVENWSQQRIEVWLNNSIVAQFWYVLFAEVLTFGGVWWFLRLRGTNLRIIGWRKPRWWDVALMLCGFAVYFFGYIVLLTIATHLFPSLNVNQKQELGFQNVQGGKNLLLTFLSLVILPPLAEETVFRGFIFTGLRARLKWGWALVITSVLFGTAHLEFGTGQPLVWVAGLDTFTLSLVLCYLRQKTDSLWPGILLHALKNSVAFMALYIIR